MQARYKPVKPLMLVGCALLLLLAVGGIVDSDSRMFPLDQKYRSQCTPIKRGYSCVVAEKYDTFLRGLEAKEAAPKLVAERFVGLAGRSATYDWPAWTFTISTDDVSKPTCRVRCVQAMPTLLRWLFGSGREAISNP